jgi:hypothetical protein
MNAAMPAQGLARVKTHLQERRDGDPHWFGEWLGIFLSFEGSAANHCGPACWRPLDPLARALWRADYARIAAMSGTMPMMFMIRVRLYARTCKAISVATRQRLHQEVGCHPGLDGAGAEGMLDRLTPLTHLLGVSSSRRWTASTTCSCSQRVIRAPCRWCGAFIPQA